MMCKMTKYSWQVMSLCPIYIYIDIHVYIMILCPKYLHLINRIYVVAKYVFSGHVIFFFLVFMIDSINIYLMVREMWGCQIDDFHNCITLHRKRQHYSPIYFSNQYEYGNDP